MNLKVNGISLVPDLVFVLIVIAWALLLSSCNTAKHMQKVYPLGFYDAGGYKANHSERKSTYDSTHSIHYSTVRFVKVDSSTVKATSQK